ncbi:hypothetical protein T439DRAFT_360878 [Meredithblackwellia eburnea MCA 4105]
MQPGEFSIDEYLDYIDSAVFQQQLQEQQQQQEQEQPRATRPSTSQGVQAPSPFLPATPSSSSAAPPPPLDPSPAAHYRLGYPLAGTCHPTPLATPAPSQLPPTPPTLPLPLPHPQPFPSPSHFQQQQQQHRPQSAAFLPSPTLSSSSSSTSSASFPPPPQASTSRPLSSASGSSSVVGPALTHQAHNVQQPQPQQSYHREPLPSPALSDHSHPSHLVAQQQQLQLQQLLRIRQADFLLARQALALQQQRQRQRYQQQTTAPPVLQQSTAVASSSVGRMSTELQILINDINGMTVDRLKNSLRAVNEKIHKRNLLKLSGNKGELSDRLKHETRIIWDSGNRENFNLLKNALQGIRDAASSPTSSFNYSNYSQSYNPQTGGFSGYGGPTSSHTGGFHSVAGSGNYGLGVGGASGSGGAVGSVSPLPPPRFNPGGQAYQGIKFRTSPFWKVNKVLNGTVCVLQKAAPGDRKSASFHFVLGERERMLLQTARSTPTAPQYQVRLYSTSDEYFDPTRPHINHSPSSAGAPVDFPPTCEIKLNGTLVPANTKGIKKQAGTAPPADLGKNGSTALDLGAGATNRVEVVYVNTDKKYYLMAALVEVTSVKQVVESIKKGKFKSKEDVVASSEILSGPVPYLPSEDLLVCTKQQTVIKQNDDPDVVATSFTLTLKDPLSFARVKTPIRSTVCNHIACFDAETFFMMNEVTPTWACPICSKVLKAEDMVVDGYFEDILNVCSSSVDDVRIEPNGLWRSSDEKYGTAPPKLKTASTAASANPSRSSSAAIGVGDSSSSSNLNPNGKGKERASESLTLDSDTDDDGPVPSNSRPPAFRKPSTAPVLSIGSTPPSETSAVRGQKRPAEVIDLTLSDDDDDDVPAPAAKRANVNQLPALVNANAGGGNPNLVPFGQPPKDPWNGRWE